MRLLLSFFVCLLLLGSDNLLFAQNGNNYIRVGASVGMSHYQGDLSDYTTAFKDTEPGFGLMAAVHFSPMWSARLTLYHGWIKGADINSNQEIRKNRNLSFRSPLTELSAQLVVDLIANDRSYLYRPKFTPYLFGGLALFAFNPRTQLNGEWIELQPLGTEGQYLPDPNNVYPDPYNLVQLSVPVGFGVRYALTDIINIEAEVGIRYTFTDYMDDLSGYHPNLEDLFAQNPVAATLSNRSEPDLIPNVRASGTIRGGPTVDDYYAYTNVTVSFILDRVKCPSIRF